MYATAQTDPYRGGQINGLKRGKTVTLRVEYSGTYDDSRANSEEFLAHGASAHNRPLIMGFGNVLLQDDGAGVHLLQRLRLEPTLRHCEFVDGGTMSFSLLSYVEAADSMLVLDAAELASPPGSVALFEGLAMDDFLKSVRRRTVHEVGLMDLLDMARMEGSLPERRALLCIQPAEIYWGDALSPTVAAGVTEASIQAGSLLARWNNP
jgi:hydrogenase maturation protease